MMHGRGESDSAIVAGKPTNKAERSVAEPVEPRTGTKGNADQQSTRRAQDRESVSQALERIRQARRHTPKVGAECPNWARSVLCGGRSAMSVPTAIHGNADLVTVAPCPRSTLTKLPFTASQMEAVSAEPVTKSR